MACRHLNGGTGLSSILMATRLPMKTMGTWTLMEMPILDLSYLCNDCMLGRRCPVTGVFMRYNSGLHKHGIWRYLDHLALTKYL
jgi:hypothetical protein